MDFDQACHVAMRMARRAWGDVSLLHTGEGAPLLRTRWERRTKEGWKAVDVNWTIAMQDDGRWFASTACGMWEIKEGLELYPIDGAANARRYQGPEYEEVSS